ncbi:hypothetical protein [Xanthomonas axonopodis]|nr:hypothetical protein [Xanthomonas axonopodis]
MSALNEVVERVRVMAGDTGHACDADSSLALPDKRATGALVSTIAL